MLQMYKFIWKFHYQVGKSMSKNQDKASIVAKRHIDSVTSDITQLKK